MFFHRNAGYSYDSTTETKAQGRSRCALKLAQAERDARALGYTFDWVEDPFADRSWFENDGQSEEPNEAFGCICRNAQGESVQSLWGIFDPTREYRRVVEAELALEEL